MAYEHNENSGSIFRNERKTQDKQPDHTGMANVDGKLYRVSAWIKTAGGSGKKFFSLAFTPADEIGGKTQTKAESQFDDQDIPF